MSVNLAKNALASASIPPTLTDLDAKYLTDIIVFGRVG